MFFSYGYPQVGVGQIGVTLPYGFPAYSPGILTPEEVREIYNQTDQGIYVTVGNETVGYRGQLVPTEDEDLPGTIIISPFEITPDLARRVPGQLRVIPNTDPPERVLDLTGQSGQAQRAILRWTNPSDDDLERLEIYRKEGGYPTGRDDEDATLVATVRENSPGVGLAVADVGLIDETTYYYWITARDLGMNWTTDVTPGENAVTATPNSPSQILDFLATDTESGEVDLTWTNPDESGLTAIKVRRKVGSYPTDETDGDEVLTDLSPVAGGANSITDTIAPGTYYYAVFPSDATGYNQLVTAGRNADTGISN